MDRSTVHELLEILAETPQPATTVDIGRAAAAGRRSVRLRRFAAVGSAALATAIVAVVVSVVASGSTALPPAPQPADSSVVPSPPAAALPTQAPKAFDPLIQYADFGWLPDGLGDRGVRTEPNHQSVSAAQPVVSPPCSAQNPSWPPNCGQQVDEPSWITLTVVSAGHTIQRGPAAAAGVQTPSFSDAEPVNGRPAKWGDPNFGTMLQWEYAPGAWAEVSVWKIDDPQRVARRVADTVNFGVDRPIRLPIRATGLPEKIRPVGASVFRTTVAGVGGWSAELHYSDTGQRASSGDWPLSLMATVSSTRTGGGGGVLADPDTTLDGYPARRINHVDGGKGLQVYDVHGVYLELSTHSPAMTKQLPGGLDTLFRGLEIYKDPAIWR